MIHRPRKYFDLQMHSLYSDGAYTPTELVDKLKKHNIKAAALTDHNTVLGIAEFLSACRKAGIQGMAGVEIYARYKKYKLHLLVYNFDYTNSQLCDLFRGIHKRKTRLLKKITPHLKRKGIDIDLEALIGEKAEYIGMNNLMYHIESKKSNVRKLQKELGRRYKHWQVYNKYFRPGLNTAYPEIYVPMKKALAAVKAAGGTTILSHPGQQLSFEEDRIILELKKMGLKGIECFSSHHKYSQVVHYLRLARDHKLAYTGGSDFHDELEDDLPIEGLWDYQKLPYELFENIKKICGFKL